METPNFKSAVHLDDALFMTLTKLHANYKFDDNDNIFIIKKKHSVIMRQLIIDRTCVMCKKKGCDNLFSNNVAVQLRARRLNYDHVLRN